MKNIIIFLLLLVSATAQATSHQASMEEARAFGYSVTLGTDGFWCGVAATGEVFCGTSTPKTKPFLLDTRYPKKLIASGSEVIIIDEEGFLSVWTCSKRPTADEIFCTKRIWNKYLEKKVDHAQYISGQTSQRDPQVCVIAEGTFSCTDSNFEIEVVGQPKILAVDEGVVCFLSSVGIASCYLRKAFGSAQRKRPGTPIFLEFSRRSYSDIALAGIYSDNFRTAVCGISGKRVYCANGVAIYGDPDVAMTEFETVEVLVDHPKKLIGYIEERRSGFYCLAEKGLAWWSAYEYRTFVPGITDPSSLPIALDVEARLLPFRRKDSVEQFGFLRLSPDEVEEYIRTEINTYKPYDASWTTQYEPLFPTNNPFKTVFGPQKRQHGLDFTIEGSSETLRTLSGLLYRSQSALLKTLSELAEKQPITQDLPLHEHMDRSKYRLFLLEIANAVLRSNQPSEYFEKSVLPEMDRLRRHWQQETNFHHVGEAPEDSHHVFATTDLIKIVMLEAEKRVIENDDIFVIAEAKLSFGELLALESTGQIDSEDLRTWFTRNEALYDVLQQNSRTRSLAEVMRLLKAYLLQVDPQQVE